MKSITILFSLLLVANYSISQQRTSIQEQYLEEVFEIVEEHSINKDSLDFKKIREKAFKRLASTTAIEDCHPIIESILRDLEDNHSFMMTKRQVEGWENTSKSRKTAELITFSGKRLDENIGYIHMKGFSSGDIKAIQLYADSLQTLIKSIDNQDLKGWILDLRENTGGNCWPMLAGIGPLLGDGICGYFINNKGEKSSWYYQNGQSGMNNNPMVKTTITPYKLINSATPIAVLTGYLTGSSGEVVTTAFHGRDRTRSFGSNTAGLSTGNRSFKLSDGSMIFLTTSVYANRKGEVFGKEIIPDVKIEFFHGSIGKENDPVIKEAIEWLLGS